VNLYHYPFRISQVWQFYDFYIVSTSHPIEDNQSTLVYFYFCHNFLFIFIKNALNKC
jgi:hypothetical protein